MDASFQDLALKTLEGVGLPDRAGHIQTQVSDRAS